MTRSYAATSRPYPAPSDFAKSLRLVRNDGSMEAWLRLMEGTKFVVLPISAASMHASGIYVCLLGHGL